MSATGLSGLRRLLERPGAERADDFCQHCGAGMSADHAHVADIQTRSLLCVCARCHDSLAGAESSGRRAVPRRYLMLAVETVPDAAWSALEIPVGIAFFFHNSTLGRSVAVYPSPAGATESLLPPASWDRVLEALPPTFALAPDVEALLVRRTHEANECYVLPVDAAYELVGRIRRRWTGFGGGPEARAEIESFFSMLRAKSERVAP